MEELCRKEYIVTMKVGTIAIIVVDIVLGIHVTEQGPGMDQGTFLRVELAEQRIEIEIEPALIAVIPNYDAGMIDVLFDHLMHQLRADLGVVSMMPPG